jgi:hypothetical protein
MPFVSTPLGVSTQSSTSTSYAEPLKTLFLLNNVPILSHLLSPRPTKIQTMWLVNIGSRKYSLTDDAVGAGKY